MRRLHSGGRLRPEHSAVASQSFGRRQAVIYVLLALCAGCAPPAAAQSGAVLNVAVANSLSKVARDIGARFTAANPGVKLRMNFAASGVLLRQIQQGAPVDVFVSASPREMESLERQERVVQSTRSDFAGNRLVLIAPPGGRVHSWDDLRQPWTHRIAIGNPDLVPVGRYARETLQHRRLWHAVQSRCVFGENAQSTFVYVSAGNVDAGIVFATDLKRLGGSSHIVAWDAPGDHAPILYTAAVIKTSLSPAAARAYIRFLSSAPALALLQSQGFIIPAAARKR